MDWILDYDWKQLIAPSITVILGVVFYQSLQRFFKAREKGSDRAVLQRQVSTFIYLLIFIIAFVLSLPIKDSLQGQIISFVGILLSASIALSSTTFLGNFMAGIWLRSVKNFRVGDLVEINEHFGRVTTRGLLHIEIQNRERDLITFPNLFLVTHPVTVMHSKGTVISAEVSLGYDVDHSVIEPLLLQAAEDAGLENPFVYIESLGDFSVVYKAHGLVKETNTILSSRSKLNGCVLDALHKAEVEIVSPSFMNQRQVNEQLFIPTQRQQKNDSVSSPEDLIFDKADHAEKIDRVRKKAEKLEDEVDELEEQLKDADDAESKEKLKEEIEKLTKQKEKLFEFIHQKEEEINKEGKDEE